MTNKEGQVGGLVSVNSGEITDCYSIWHKSAGTEKTLVCKNTGRIATAILVEKGRALSFFASDGIEYRENIDKTSELTSRGFDTAKVWKFIGNDELVGYIETAWQGRPDKNGYADILHISTSEEYLDFINKVNSGDKKILRAYVILENDIDFKGKEIPPLADKKENAFEGVLDGNGHLIWNFFINDKENTYSAPIGYLKGKIVNLIVDCRVSGPSNIAGLVGLNEGLIECCGSLVRLDVTNSNAKSAGLVSVNEGRMSKSYSLIVINRDLMPLLIILCIALFLIMIGLFTNSAIPAVLAAGRDYAAIESDEDQEKYENVSDSAKESSNYLAFTLNQSVIISKSTGRCKLDFKNPAIDSNKIVIEIQIDGVDGERITIGKSKAVMPGYQLEYLKLNDDAFDYIDDNVKEGYITLVPYNVDTEDKGMVNTELPVDLVFEE